LVPATPSPLPGLHPADAIPLAPLSSDASAAVHPDEAADAIVPALAAVPCAEKLVGPAPVVPASAAKLHPARAFPAQAEVLYTPDAGRSAA